MKKVLIIVCVVLLFCSFAVEAGSIYSDQTGRFSFEIPYGWRLVSQDAIKARKEAVEGHIGKQTVSKLDVVLQKDGNIPFAPPYIVINVYEHYGAMTKKDFERKYAKNSRKKLIGGFAGEAVRKGVVQNLKSDDALFDYEKAYTPTNVPLLS